MGEAKKLLENGVRLSDSLAWQHQESSHNPKSSASRQMGAADAWAYKPYTAPPPEPTFDILTQVKGWTIVITSLTIFSYAMREFLANSAGGTMKWHPGTGVRRFGHIEK